MNTESVPQAAEAIRWTPPKKTLLRRLGDWWEEFKDNRRIPIQEEDGAHKAWYKEAREVRTPKELARFTERMRSAYRHDYGTICHAVAASAVAAAWCVDRGPTGGITGFQAGAIFWEFARAWKHVEGPARLLEYDNMIYPQYAEQFDKIISANTWEHLQKKAAEHLAAETHAHPDIAAHWRGIVEGKVPFGYRVAVKEKN